MTSPPLPAEMLDSPIPPPRLSSPGLFFSGQDNATTLPDPGQPLTDPLTGEPTPAPAEPLADWDSGSEWSDDGSTHPSGDPTSSPTSPAGKANPLTKRAAKDTARAAVLTAGVMAHKSLAHTQGQLQAGLYLTDEEDAAAIGDPLGNLAHRHAGKLGGAVSDDTADLMQAMFGVAGYFAKQINATAAARRIDAGGQPAPVEGEGY